MEEAQGDEDLKAKLVAYVSHYFPWIIPGEVLMQLFPESLSHTIMSGNLEIVVEQHDTDAFLSRHGMAVVK
jgi:hypothetical protein